MTEKKKTDLFSFFSADIMPDVAMNVATASLGQLQLGDPPESLQLDLGDGPSHMMGGASGIGVLGIQVCISFFALLYTNPNFMNTCGCLLLYFFPFYVS